MRFHWLRGRAIVHATEDEDRVKNALAWALGLDRLERGLERIERQRAKGHYGNDILILEGHVKKESDIEAALERMFADAVLREDVRATILKRLDEENVLHVRVDKQALVGQRFAVSSGSDAVVVTAKIAAFPGDVPARSWAQFLDALPPA